MTKKDIKRISEILKPSSLYSKSILEIKEKLGLEDIEENELIKILDSLGYRRVGKRYFVK